MRNINYRPIKLYTIKKFSDRPMPRSHYGTCAALIKASCRTICLGYNLNAIVLFLPTHYCASTSPSLFDPTDGITKQRDYTGTDCQ